MVNLAKLGKRFVLQGGTQHCGESGAIGAAKEARRLHLEQGKITEWIGLEKVPTIAYRQKRDESTRCCFCKNKCLRTLIDVDLEIGNAEAEQRMAQGQLVQIQKHTKLTQIGTKRLIIATCEKGEVEDVEKMRKIKSGSSRTSAAMP